MVAGFVVAFVVLLVFGFVIPRTHARKAILAQTPLSERFSEDLRIVRAPALAIEGDGERGTIFTTERKMTTHSTTGGKGKVTRKLPTIARDRSRAKARVSTRAAYRVRGLLGMGALAVVTLIAWISVGVTAVPVAVAIVATVVTGLYAVGFGYAVFEWAKADDVDIETIENATKVLSKAKHKQAKSAKKIAGASTKATKAEKSSSPSVPAPEKSEPAVSEVAEPAASVEAAAPKTADKSAEKPAEKAPTVVRPKRTGFVPAPSYTLKPAITKRTVKPYEAPAAPEVASPYRPKRVGERLGDAPIEAANPAPEMTGQAELRTDLLGGGSTLDKLLEQRRA